jgi:8-oxo-dGTP pyrophosphatase MutT (NUDIX family)
MELPRKFENRPNGRVRLKYNFNGNNTELDYFISRAPAVVGVVFIFGLDSLRVLVTQRSEKMMDEAGKFGVPCGYLDWDETGYFGMMREVYEETSFFMPDYEKFQIFNNNKQPFFVKDDPKKDKRQNVSLLYVSAYDFEGKADQFPLAEIEAFACKETAKVVLMKVIDFFNTNMNYDWAFNHDETIQMALQYFNKNFNRAGL